MTGQHQAILTGVIIQESEKMYTKQSGRLLYPAIHHTIQMVTVICI